MQEQAPVRQRTRQPVARVQQPVAYHGPQSRPTASGDCRTSPPTEYAVRTAATTEPSPCCFEARGSRTAHPSSPAQWHGGGSGGDDRHQQQHAANTATRWRCQPTAATPAPLIPPGQTELRDVLTQPEDVYQPGDRPKSRGADENGPTAHAAVGAQRGHGGAVTSTGAATRTAAATSETFDRAALKVCAGILHFIAETGASRDTTCCR